VKKKRGGGENKQKEYNNDPIKRGGGGRKTASPIYRLEGKRETRGISPFASGEGKCMGILPVRAATKGGGKKDERAGKHPIEIWEKKKFMTAFGPKRERKKEEKNFHFLRRGKEEGKGYTRGGYAYMLLQVAGKRQLMGERIC